jgi:hypothetical protein
MRDLDQRGSGRSFPVRHGVVVPSSAGLQMRYLFGDSTPFPLQYNFLQTLEVFVASAARVVELDAQSRIMNTQLAEAAALRLRNIEGLERFHQVVMRALHDSSTRSMEGLMVDYAHQLSDHATRIVEAARAGATASGERDQAQARAETERRRGEIRGAIEQFFKVSRLPILGATVAMRLPIAKEAQHEMSAVISFAEAIIVGYTLAAEQLADWRHPRKVGELAPGIQLMVGAKKSWFKKTSQPELVSLDEYILGGFELSDDAAFIRLRRRPEQPDSLVFTVRRIDTNLVAEVTHPDDPEGQVPSPVDAQDRAHLERLWQLLRKSVMPAIEHKTRVVSIHLDGEEIFASEKVQQLVQRIIKLLAPTVAEIARRSPNPIELSLKIEHEGGRREEIYVKKADLVAKLIPLAPPEIAVFAPLALGQQEPTVIAPAD